MSEQKNEGPLNADALLSFVTRVENLNAQKTDLSHDIAAVFADAKAFGFDVKVLREVIKERSIDRDDLDEMEVMKDLYHAALERSNAQPPHGIPD